MKKMTYQGVPIIINARHKYDKTPLFNAIRYLWDNQTDVYVYHVTALVRYDDTDVLIPIDLDEKDVEYIIH